jgi:hypothetical protein
VGCERCGVSPLGGMGASDRGWLAAVVPTSEVMSVSAVGMDGGMDWSWGFGRGDPCGDMIPGRAGGDIAFSAQREDCGVLFDGGKMMWSAA